MNLRAHIGPFLAAAVLFIAGAGRATASTITTFGTNSITQTATYGPGPTDATQAQTVATFNDFASAGAPAGAVLQSVQISVGLNVTISSLDFTNLDGTLQAAVENFTYLSYSGFDLFGTLASGDLSRLSSGLPSTLNPVILYSLGDAANGLTQAIGRNQVMSLIGPAPTVPQGATLVSPSPGNVGAYTADNGNGNTGQYGDSDLNPYQFATSVFSNNPSAYAGVGQFTLAYDTAVRFSVNGGGGNLAFNQSTQTSGTDTVVYNYTVPNTTTTPEPSTWLLIGTGLFGLVYRARAIRLTSRRAS